MAKPFHQVQDAPINLFLAPGCSTGRTTWIVDKQSNEMAESSEAIPFEMGDEPGDSVTLDNTCPDCGTESIATYMDRYSSYEYCTYCDWSDEDGYELAHEATGRSDRRREEA